MFYAHLPPPCQPAHLPSFAGRNSRIVSNLWELPLKLFARLRRCNNPKRIVFGAHLPRNATPMALRSSDRPLRAARGSGPRFGKARGTQIGAVASRPIPILDRIPRLERDGRNLPPTAARFSPVSSLGAIRGRGRASPQGRGMHQTPRTVTERLSPCPLVG
jgi:hypothetical protein